MKQSPPTMRTTLITLATVCLLSISCTKTIDNPLPVENPKLKSLHSQSAPIEKKFVVDGDTVVLRLVMEPIVACDSYRPGETPKPCNIFVLFTFTLSQPVDGYVNVDVQKTNMTEFGDPKLTGSKAERGFVLNIAPNTTKFSYTSSFSNNNTVSVAENTFSIENISVYKFVN